MNKSDFVFKGKWKFELSLPKLASLNKDIEFNSSDLPHKDTVKITIYDKLDDNPDPTEEQLATITWIQNNESSLLESIYKIIKKTVYPLYKKEIGYDPIFFPSIRSVDDLPKIISQPFIDIQRAVKDGYAYFSIYFEQFTADSHGFGVNMHKSRTFDFGAYGDHDYKKVAKDIGVSLEDFFEKHLRTSRNGELKLHSPHPKYGKLKPWQQDANEYYPYRLLHTSKIDQLIEYIESENISIDGSGSSSFLGIAIRQDYQRFIDYALARSPKKLHAPFVEAMKKDNFELMKRIIDAGYNVNERVGTDSLLYDLTRELEKNQSKPEQVKLIKQKIEFLFANQFDPYLEDYHNRNAYQWLKNTNSGYVKKMMSVFFKEMEKKYNLIK